MKVHLPVRLFISHAVVALVGAAAAYVTVRVLAPRLFRQRVNTMWHNGRPSDMGPNGANPTSVQAAFIASLDRALVLGIVISLIAAGVVAMLVTRRLMRPLNDVRAATRRIAGGDYEGRVPLPADPEMAALAADVNTLAKTLADTETRRTRLLGDVAHEMRTPLTTLDGYIEGMIDGVFQADPVTLDVLGHEVRRLHRLSDDLSLLSRAQEHRVELTRAHADLGTLVVSCGERLQPQFDDAGVALSVQVVGQIPVTVDADRITQVLTNLLGNALLATPVGGSVSVVARVEGRHAVVHVSDTGVGISEPDLGRIFERFYRADAQGRRSGGSGVGLTIARDLARAHGGTLTASSPGIGQGAVFTLMLPLG